MFGLGVVEFIIASIISALQILVTVFVIIYLIYTIYFRKKFLTVHVFETAKSHLPGVLKVMPNENILQYARNFTYKNQFYLTNLRFVFFHESMLMGKSFTRYFEITSVRNVEIAYKNPYGWLIYSGITFIVGVTYAISSANKNTFIKDDFNTGIFLLLLLSSIIYCGLYVLLWYYLKGYYLILDNGKTTGLFCRSSEGLESVVRKFDLLKLSSGEDVKSEFILKEEIVSRDFTCNKCKSVITLEGDDLEKVSFNCPVCGNVNPVTN